MGRLVHTLAALLIAVATSVGAEDYVLQPGDRIEISVLEDPGLNRTALVQPDGRISLPLAGVIEVGGRTPAEAQRIIASRLSRDFITPPNVTVSLLSLGSPVDELDLISVYVLGQVRRPGLFEVERPVDLLQLLALAGGPDVFAASRRIQVRRRAAIGSEEVLFFDYKAIEDGLVPSGDIALADGDVVIVPERRLFE